MNPPPGTLSGTAAEAWLQVSDLTLRRGPRLLFEQVAFGLRRGEALLLRGANGVGKSSLLRALVGLTPADAGQIRVADQTFRPATGRLGAHALYQGHAGGLKFDLTARENLALIAGLDGSPSDESALNNALAAVGLAREGRLPVRRLSQGQKQRLGLARLVLGSHRTLWLLDEPSAALDAEGAAWLDARIGAHLDAGGTAIVATHLPILSARNPSVLSLTAARAP